jgi:hypothetical protein
MAAIVPSAHHPFLTLFSYVGMFVRNGTVIAKMKTEAKAIFSPKRGARKIAKTTSAIHL